MHRGSDINGASTRDIYYKQLPSYSSLAEWQSLLTSGKISEAVAYWRQHRDLHPDMYVCKRPNFWVTVFYLCLTRAEYAEMAKVIFRRADATLPPDADAYYLLPFVCHGLYLQALVTKILQHSIPPDDSVIRHSISHVLDRGDICRLGHLVQLGYLSEVTLRSYVVTSDDVILCKLQVMIKYLTYCYNVRRDADLDLTKETCDTIYKFGQTVKFLMSYGAQWTQEATRLCTSHYIYEILDAHADASALYDVEAPIYHTQMDATRVAILRPLLNDYRYVETCRVLGRVPDSDVYDYNI